MWGIRRLAITFCVVSFGWLASCSTLVPCQSEADCGEDETCIVRADDSGTCVEGEPVGEGEGEGEGEGNALSLTATETEGNAPLDTTIEWSLGEFDAADCSLTQSDGEPIDVTLGTLALALNRSTTFVLTCAGEQPLSVEVRVSRVSDFISSPEALDPSLSTVTLTWTAVEATDCEVAASPAGTEPSIIDNQSATHEPDGETSYTLTCEGLGGPIVVTLDLPFLDVDIDEASTPDVVTFGNDLAVVVNVTRRADCVLSGGDGIAIASEAPQASDTRTIVVPGTSLAASATFDVTCTLLDANDSDTINVSVAPDVSSFDVKSVATNNVTFEWDVLGAGPGDSCVLTDDDGGGGSAPFPAVEPGLSNFFGAETVDGRYTYTLACTAADGTPSSTSLDVVWGDVSQPNQLAGVRAVEGSVNLLGVALGTGNINNTALKLVGGSFRIENTTGASSIDVVFSGLEVVNGDLSAENNPFRSASFPALTRIGGSLSVSGNAGLESAAAPALTEIGGGVSIINNAALDTMDLASLEVTSASANFNITDNGGLSCTEIAEIYCDLSQREPSPTTNDGVDSCANVNSTCTL